MVSDKKNTPRKAAPNPKANSSILGITYLMVALFLGCLLYTSSLYRALAQVPETEYLFDLLALG